METAEEPKPEAAPVADATEASPPAPLESIEAEPVSLEAPVPPSAWRAIFTACVVTATVTLISRFAPDRYAATAVGVAFLAATWFLVLRRDEAIVRAHGLSLGGILEPTRLDGRRIAKDALVALAYVVPLMLVVFPLFWLGYAYWWHVRHPFTFHLRRHLLDEIAGQLVVIALPEEAFFRGYLQTELENAWPRKVRILGADLGLGWLVSAAIFAVGHVLTVANPARLAVFFPALVFGWLRARTRGIGAGVVFHASCNLLSATLARGYGLG